MSPKGSNMSSFILCYSMRRENAKNSKAIRETQTNTCKHQHNLILLYQTNTDYVRIKGMDISFESYNGQRQLLDLNLSYVLSVLSRRA